jgi:3-methyl-2-oxobutanoate hydroxymethyltransferase
MLTCYDYTTATHMRAAGVPMLLVGDSAASVILGYPTTLPVSLSFLIELTAAVRRGHPEAFLVADMPFGSYHASTAQGVKNVVKMVQQGHPDAVKLEVSDAHLPVIRRCTDAGVAVIAHIGLRPQAIGVMGGYKTQGRTESAQDDMVELAVKCQEAGAVAILIEAVPSETAGRVVDATGIPIIGCGAGPRCHGHVVVTHDLLGLSSHRPKFVPSEPDLATPMQKVFTDWVKSVASGKYPAPEHEYSMALTRTGTRSVAPH